MVRKAQLSVMDETDSLRYLKATTVSIYISMSADVEAV